MDKNPLIVSFAPHVRGSFCVKNLMWGVVIALSPALTWSIYVFGVGALKVILISVASCIIFEHLIQKYVFQRPTTISDGSAVITGILLAFNVPSNLPWWIIIIGSLAAIGIAKMTFGGLGNNPFNPALVGRVFLLISFPVQMTSWPKPDPALLGMDTVTGATPLAIIKEGIRNGVEFSSLVSQIPSYFDLFIGKTGGSIGEISALALLLGFIYMLYKKIITWHIPVSMIGTIFAFTGILWLINPSQNADPVFHMLTGGVLLGAIFMATDYVTSPMDKKGMFIYGVCIGIITVVIRVWGAYPEGVSFAILIMNAFVPLINRYCKPRLFGE